MNSYDGTTDLDEQIENIEAVLTYRSVQGAVKCKLFVTTLRRGAVTWFKNLRRNFIDSWSDLCHEFTTHFTASRTQPKTVASLEAIVQGKSKPLRDYIERFNKEAVQLRGVEDSMKQYLITKGLREGTYVKKAIWLDRPESPSRRKRRKAKQSVKVKHPVVASREKIAVADLAEAGVKPPKPHRRKERESTRQSTVDSTNPMGTPPMTATILKMQSNFSSSEDDSSSS